MKITAHHHVNEILQRSYVEFQGRRYVRLARSFDPVTGELQPDPGPPAPAQVWKVEHGVGFETLGPNRSETLEKAFIDELIAQNSKPKLSACFGAAVKVEPPTTKVSFNVIELLSVRDRLTVRRVGSAACREAYRLQSQGLTSGQIRGELINQQYSIFGVTDMGRLADAGAAIERILAENR
jgi:hypothetical protein